MPNDCSNLKSLSDLISWELESAGDPSSCLSSSEEDAESTSPLLRSLRGKLRYLASRNSLLPQE